MLLILISVIIWSSPAHGLSIDEIPSLVQQQNNQVQAQKIETEHKREGASAATRRLFPSIDLKTTYTRLDQDIVIDVEKKRIERDVLDNRLSVALEVDPPPVLVQERNVLNSHLLLKQPIYAGGRILAGMDAADADLAAAEATQSLVYNKELEGALVLYFQVQLAKELVAVFTGLEQSTRELEKIGASLVTTGVKPKLTLLQIQSALSDLESKKWQAEHNLTLASLAFRQATGMDSLKPPELTSRLITLPPPQNFLSFRDSAIRKRQELNILDATKNKVEALKEAETGSMLPMVYGFAKYELAKEDLTALQPEWAVGIGIDIPLTGSLHQMPKRRQALLLQNKIKTLQKDAKEKITLEVDQHSNAVKNGSKSLEATKKALQASQEALRLATARFKAGRGSTMEVIYANSDVEKLQIKRWVQVETYNRSLIQLFRAAGNVEAFLNHYDRGQKHASH